MQKINTRAFFVGLAVFIAFVVQTILSGIISGNSISFIKLLPAIIGGLVAGLAVYLLYNLLIKKKKSKDAIR